MFGLDVRSVEFVQTVWTFDIHVPRVLWCRETKSFGGANIPATLSGMLEHGYREYNMTTPPHPSHRFTSELVF